VAGGFQSGAFQNTAFQAESDAVAAPTFSRFTFSSISFSTRDEDPVSLPTFSRFTFSSITFSTKEEEGGGAVVQPLANSGGGAGKRELWRVYQEILAADLKRKPETKKRKKRKVVEPVLDLPVGGLDGLRAEIATERAAIAVLDAQERARAVIRQRREAQDRIEWLATQERALEAAIAEVERRRRKRNNETAMLLLAA
jgi:hypothetical protein